MDFFAGARSEQRKKGGFRKLGGGGGWQQRRLSNTLGRFWYSSEPAKEIKEFNSALISFLFFLYFPAPRFEFWLCLLSTIWISLLSPTSPCQHQPYVLGIRLRKNLWAYHGINSRVVLHLSLKCLSRVPCPLARQHSMLGYNVKFSWSDTEWLSKQRLFMHVLFTGAGNKKMLSFCCAPLKATLHTIAAKSLPNWIIQSSPIALVV